LDVELVSFHTGAGIMISLWLQGVCMGIHAISRLPIYDAIRTDHAVTRNAPKLTYSSLRFQNFPREETPVKKGKREDGIGKGKGR